MFKIAAFLILAIFGITIFPCSISFASTYKQYYCSKQDLAPEETYQCDFHYDLKHSNTKEFRGTCVLHDNITDTDYNDFATGMSVSGKNNNTTCTSTVTSAGVAPPYRSKSCTNWKTSGKDTIKVKVKCNSYTPLAKCPKSGCS